VVESLLVNAGFTLTPVPDARVCCGSAGTYSILPPELSQQLRTSKLRALESGQRDSHGEHRLSDSFGERYRQTDEALDRIAGRSADERRALAPSQTLRRPVRPRP